MTEIAGVTGGRSSGFLRHYDAVHTKLIYDSPLIIPNIEILFDCSASFNDGGKSIPTNTCCMTHLTIKRDKLKHLLSLN